jgi:lambda family phage tail tape measure protein
MGKGATEVQVLMNLGREGIEEFRREAVALGLVLDADTRQKLANLNDAFDKLSQLSRALGNAIAREVLPTFSGIAKSMLEAAKQTSAFQTAAQAVHVVLKLIASGASIASTAMKGFAIILAAQLAALRAFGSGEITQGLDILRMAFDDLRQNAQENATFLTQLWKETLPQLADATDKATKNNNEFTRSSDANVKAVTSLLSSLKEQIAIINESLILGRDLNAAEQLRTKILGDLEDGTLKLTLAEAKRIDLLLRLLDLRIKEKAEFDIEQKALDDIVQQNVALYDLIKAQEFENRTIGMTRREVEALALTRHDANIAMLQGAIDENFASEETIALLRIQLDLLKKLRDLERKGFQQRNDSSALAGLKKAWDDFSEQVGSISKDMETIFGTAVRGMEDMFVEFLTKGKADFKGFVEEMGQTLLRLAFRRALFELGKSFIPGFGGTSTTAGAGLAGVAKPNALSSTGPVSGFSAPSGTTSKAGAGTIVVNITNNIDSRSDAAAIAQANERTRRQVVAEVSDLMRRGSPMFAR